MFEARVINRLIALVVLSALILPGCLGAATPAPSQATPGGTGISTATGSPTPVSQTQSSVNPTASPVSVAETTIKPQGSAPAQSPSPVTAGTKDSPTPTPARPKVVKIGVPHEPDTITGWPPGRYVSGVAQNLLFNVLVAVDDKMNPYPDLAEQVPTLDNGLARWVGDGAARQLEVTFRLRKGVTWSDGKPLTAKDVVFTWELMLNPDSGANPDTELKYEKVVATDDHTVVFTFFSERSAQDAAAQDPKRYGNLGFAEQKGPVIDPLYSFGLPNSYIYPAHVLGPLVEDQPRTSKRALDLMTKSEFARTPVGSGPYTLRDWTPGTSLTFAARQDYFKGAPKIGVVMLSIIPKAETLIAQLKAGEIDMITQDALDIANIPELEQLSNAAVHYTPSVAWEHIDLNLSDPILKDKLVRQALYYGTNRQELVDRVFLGKTTPVNNVVLDWSWAYSKDVPGYPYEPRRAAELLDQAGWHLGPDGIRQKGGQKLRLTLQTTDAPVRMKSVPILKEQYRKIGVDLVVEHIPSKAYFDRRTGPLVQRTYQLGQYAWISGYDPGADSAYAFHSRNIPSRENNFAGGNYPGFRNSEVDRLLDQGLATLDQRERVRLYHQFQRSVMDELPTLPLYAHPNITAVSKRLVNFKPSRGSIGETWNVHEWDLK